MMAQMGKMRRGEVQELAPHQEPAEDRAEDDGGDSETFHPAVGPDQFFRREVLGQNSILGGRVHGGTDADKAVGKERVQAGQHGEAACHLDRVADEHHAPLRQRIRERTDEGREHDVGEYEKDLQHRRLPARRVHVLEQGNGGEQQSVIGECGEKLRRQDRVEAAGHPAC